MSVIGIGFLVIGGLLVWRGLSNPKDKGYPAKEAAPSDEMNRRIVWDRGISNCSKRRRDQEEIDSCTTHADGWRYYT